MLLTQGTFSDLKEKIRDTLSSYLVKIGSHHLVTMLLQDVPSQIARSKGLVTQLALDLLLLDNLLPLLHIIKVRILHVTEDGGVIHGGFQTRTSDNGD